MKRLLVYLFLFLHIFVTFASCAPDSGGSEFDSSSDTDTDGDTDADTDTAMDAPQPRQMAPLPWPGDLRAVHGSSESDIWVAGNSRTMAHFNGSEWETHLSPITEQGNDWAAIEDIWGTSSNIYRHRLLYRPRWRLQRRQTERRR